MNEEKHIQPGEPGSSRAGSNAGSYAARSTSPSFDLLQPWKIISQNNIYIIYLSVLLFAFYAFARHGFSWIALSTSLIVSVPIGFAIAFFETQSQEFRRRHRRTKFWFYLVYRTFRVVCWFMVLFFFIMVIVSWLGINTYETIFPLSLYDFFATRKIFEFLGIALIISLLSNFMDELHRKLGRDAIYNLVLGKYHQVKQEERLFLFIDLNNSTDIAEEMGEMEFSHFLQDFFYDISEPIARYFGRVYQYVGDEVVVTWPVKKGLRYAVCARCFFAIQKQIRRYAKQYQKRYGRVPEFKAALHGGKIVVSEVGKYKSEIAYHGDVLNTTARMLSKCHEFSAELIVSDYILHKVEMPKYLQAEGLGPYQLKGKQQEIELHAVYLAVTKDAVEKRRRRLFRRRTQQVE
ncbi:MAG TPA: adenylate/guanylate cyclase domain-containing protein [Chitinophagaceae bacterium]|jgi:adenylate cyclase|nr:adenylate/guanylate cyclase domain-containing protein [Chitinophagaceae bacterium]